MISERLSDSRRLLVKGRRAGFKFSDTTLSVCSTSALFTVDLVALGGVTGLALAVRGLLTGACDRCGNSTWMTACIALAVLVAGLMGVGSLAGRYDRRRPFWADLRQVGAPSLVFGPALVGLSLLPGETQPLLGPILIVLGFPLLAGPAGLAAKRALPGIGLWALPVLVIGAPQDAAKAAAALQADRTLGYRVVRQVDPVLGAARIASASLRELLDQSGARFLLLADVAQPELRLAIIQAALREKVAFATMPALPAFACDLTRLCDHDITLLSSRHGLNRPLARLAKTVVDVVIATMMLVLLLPLMTAIAIAVRLDGGPALFRHRRLGIDGASFGCLKFRTMHSDAEAILTAALQADGGLAAEWRQSRKLRDDPRVTRLGKFLRSTSLDELPQLLNVVRLEMSLVGPRPIVPAEVPFYGEEIAHYYATRPGITGLWQVSGRSGTSYQKRVELDVRYVNNWTAALDFSILFRTIPAVLMRRGAH